MISNAITIEQVTDNLIISNKKSFSDHTFDVYATEKGPFLYDADFLKLSKLKNLNFPELLYESPEVRKMILRKTAETGEYTGIVYLVGGNILPIRMSYCMTRQKNYLVTRIKYSPENKIKNFFMNIDQKRDLIFLNIKFPIHSNEYIVAGLEFDHVFNFLDNPTIIVTVQNPEEMNFIDLNDLFITLKRWGIFCKKTDKIRALVAIMNKNYFALMNMICVSSGCKFLHYAKDIADATLIAESLQNSISV